jgi:hypothetical protein
VTNENAQSKIIVIVIITAVIAARCRSYPLRTHRRRIATVSFRPGFGLEKDHDSAPLRAL